VGAVKLAKQDRALIAFVANLVAIVLLSKIGGTGGDLAVMTGLIGVAGMLAQRRGDNPKDDTATGRPGDPVHVEPER
jgi:hypothetical protein